MIHKSKLPYTTPTATRIIAYIQEKYDAAPEFLWARFPNNAIFRNKNNKKWFAALLIVPKNKLGIKGESNVEIVDIKANPMMISLIIDNKTFFPGYHMNKEHWITIRLDVPPEEKNLLSLIDESYRMSSLTNTMPHE